MHLKIFAVILAGSSTAVNASHPAAARTGHFLPEVTKKELRHDMNLINVRII